VRAVPLPGIDEQSGEPSGNARSGGNRSGMLQQHALPRCGVPPHWLGPGHAAWAGSQAGAFRIRRVRLLSGLPRDELLGRHHRDLLLHLPRGDCAAPVRSHLGKFHYPDASNHGPGQRLGVRAVSFPWIPVQPGEPSGHASPGRNAAGMLQQHVVPLTREA
jgi:hypothetical protein